MKVVLISGKATHGKDFTANILKQELEKRNNKPLILHYADYLKFLCKSAYAWDGKKDENGRTLLQHIGTDLARNNNPDIWVNVVIETIKALKTEFDYFIIPDTRFPNEIERMVDEFGETSVININVKRDNYVSGLSAEQLKHPSETALDKYSFDHVLVNKEGRESVLFNLKEAGLIDTLYYH